MGRNLWYCISTRALETLEGASRFNVDGLILEFEPSDEFPSGPWHRIFHALALYEGVPELEKADGERAFTLKLRAGVTRVIEAAARRGIQIFIMGPELAYPPDVLARCPALADPGQPAMTEVAAARLDEIYAALPGLAGIKLYLDEGDVNITDLHSPVPPVDRLYRLIAALLEVSRAKDRTLIVSTFTLMPHQQRVITECLRRFEPEHHLLVDNYVCPGDWGRIRLRNPAIAAVGEHRQIISFDYCGEVWGQSVIPLCQADFLARVWQDGAGQRVEGMAGYVSWGGDPGKAEPASALGTPNEASMYAAAAISRGEPADGHSLVLDWAQQRYGAGAARWVASALGRTREVVLQSWHDLGFWVHELPKSQPADIAWYNWSLHWESLAIWDGSFRQTEQALFQPTEHLVAAIVAEKDGAIRLALASLADLTEARPFLGAAEYLELRRYFERELTMCRAFRLYSEVFYRARMWRSGDLRQTDPVRMALAEMRALAQEIEESGDAQFWTCRPGRLSFLAGQLEDIMDGGSWPEPADAYPGNSWHTPESFRVAAWNEQLRVWGYDAPEEGA